MTKRIIRVFLFLFFLNGLLYCGWLNIKLFLTHKTSKNALANFSAQQSEFQKIATNDLDKDESDEVWFKGQLFDVVKRERIKDTEYVYVAPDKEEQDVLDIIFDHFQSDDHSLLLEEVNKITPLKHMSRAIDWHYILGRPQEFFHHNPAIGALIIKTPPELTDASEVLTPPPRKIRQSHTPVL